MVTLTLSDACREHLREMAGRGGMSALVEQLIEGEWVRRGCK
jgi:hypothetical protein